VVIRVDKYSLVLEGGGMRGMYTSGVLDAFMDNNLYINNIYAVSAGCYNAVSYLSRQRGRTYRINTTYLKDKRYINFIRILTKGSVVNTDFIFNEVFNELDPFDYEAFKKNSKRFCAVSTNCETGEPHYALIKDLHKDVEYVKASAALPLFTSIVKVDDLKLVDGGVSDSIPIEKAISDGFSKNIIILTRPKGFVMGPNKHIKLNKLRYKNYPNLIKAIENRYLKYNEILELIERLENENKVIVIRPKESLNIANLEKNMERIKQIYEMGYEDGLMHIDRVKKFIGVSENVKKENKRV